VLLHTLLRHSTQGLTVCTVFCCKRVAEWLTTATDYNGAYLENGNLSDDVQPPAQNPADVDKLWELSERLVGEKFCY
jgi:hypothetical protein